MEMRTLSPDEIPSAKPLLQKLADYHNSVAASFPGVNPVTPLDESLADAVERMKKDHGEFFALFDDAGAMAGLCGMQYYAPNGEIDWLYVREDLRGLGWGEKLMDAAMKRLKAKGVTFVDVFVVRGNPAREFYLNAGFEERVEILSKRI